MSKLFRVFLTGIFCLCSALFVVPGPLSAVQGLAVAVHDSPASRECWRYTSWKDFHASRFLKEALAADGIPFVVVTDDEIAAGDLLEEDQPRYPILFSLQQECISDAVAAQLADFAEAGGTLFAAGSAWTRNEHGDLRADAQGRLFALSAELGLRPAGWALTTHIQKQLDDPMVSGLPIGPYEWQMPRDYDFLDLKSHHWIFGTRPSALSPASVIATTAPHPLEPAARFLAPEINDERIVEASGQSALVAADIHFVDVDGDGSHDLVQRKGTEIQVRLSTGQNFAPPQEWLTNWPVALSLAVADLDGDGRADLVGRNPANTVRWALSTGTAFVMSAETSVWSSDYEIRFADVDADGDADILGERILSPASPRDLQVGKWQGSSFLPSTAWIGSALLPAAPEVYLADINADGRADLLTREGGSLHFRLSSGTAFGAKTLWGSWASGLSLRLADVDGDGRADALGAESAPASPPVGVWPQNVRRNLSVALAGNLILGAPQIWFDWPVYWELRTTDVNGDYFADLVGYLPSTMPPVLIGDLRFALAEPSSQGYVKLARRAHGEGEIVYNAEPNPLAGYGGYANDNSEYQAVRKAIEVAFARLGKPLVSLGTWPFPFQSAIVFRHDHFLALDLQTLERSRVPAAQTENHFGEYYIWPATDPLVWPPTAPCFSPSAPLPPPPNAHLGGAGSCGDANNYPLDASLAVSRNAVIGAHVVGHYSLDGFSGDYCVASGLLDATIGSMQLAAPHTLSMAFAATAHQAIQIESLEAVRDAGFLSSGEQGVGPFPVFSMDVESEEGYVGTVLQLPTSEAPAYPKDASNLEEMSADPSLIQRAVDLAVHLGGLINVYDHAGGDGYLGGCGPYTGQNPGESVRVFFARKLLDYAAAKVPRNRLWWTNALDIRSWWLQRHRHRIVGSSALPDGQDKTVVTLAFEHDAPLAATSFPAAPVAVELPFNSQLATQSLLGLRVYADGILLNPAGICTSSGILICNSSGLSAQVGGSATTVRIEIGPHCTGILCPPES